MKKIRYKTRGTMLVTGHDGELVPSPVDASVEKEYSEDALQRAEEVAIPGSIVIVGDDDFARAEHPEETDSVSNRMLLSDRATNKIYELYVENGKLMMEVL